MNPRITDNCQGRPGNTYCQLYSRNSSKEPWQTTGTRIRLSRMREALAWNEKHGTWRSAEYRIEPANPEITSEDLARLRSLESKPRPRVTEKDIRERRRQAALKAVATRRARQGGAR